MKTKFKNFRITVKIFHEKCKTGEKKTSLCRCLKNNVNAE